MRVALRVAYDGMLFQGYARQPDALTVEGSILEALTYLGAVSDPREARIQSASRTDRGVSAAANVLALDVDFDPRELAGALNALLAGIAVYGMLAVPDDFNPRHAARSRWYRYMLPAGKVRDTGRLEQVAGMFTGQHDFGAFCKSDDREKSTALAVDSFTVERQGEFLLLDIRARSFLWQMVRRMVAAMLAVDSGRLDPGHVEEMLAGRGKWPGLEPAAPEPLILMDVDCGLEFVSVMPDASSHFLAERQDALLRAGVMGQVAGRIQSLQTGISPW